LSVEKKRTPGAEAVPDHIPRRHDDSPVSEETKRALDKQLWEAEHQSATFDESAATKQYAAEIGTSATALHKGVTTSPKIPRHDNLWTRLKNAHPYLDSSDVEELMEMIYGQSVGAASRDNFASYDHQMAEDILSLDQLQVKALLEDVDEEEDYDDETEAQ